MTWSKKQNQEGCPPDKPWAVVEDDTGEVDGCFTAEDEADAAVEELNAEEAEEPDTADMAEGGLYFSAIAPHSTATDDESSWDGGAAEKKLNNTEANNKKMYAWKDPTGDPAARGSYKFPHHNVNDNGSPGAANTSGASAGIAALNGGRGGHSLPAQDRQGVHNHLAKHLRDAGKDVPELMSLEDIARYGLANEAAGSTEPTMVETAEGNALRMPVMVIEGTWTGDNRWIDPGALTWRELPLPVMAIAKTTMGHEEAELVGKLTSIERGDANADGLIDARTGEGYPEGTTYLKGEGVFDTAEKAQEIHRLINDGMLRGVSVDLSDVTSDIVFIDKDGNEQEDIDLEGWLFGDDEFGDLEIGEKVRSGRMMGATICPFPAFEGAYVEVPEPLVAGGFDVSWISTHPDEEFPEPTDERWASIVNHDRPYASNRPRSLVASGIPATPPSAWFKDPVFTEKTAMTIDKDGHIYGHMASWDECHTAFTGQCIIAPRNHSEYAYFRVGAVLCDDDLLVPTGVLSMDGGHADIWMNAAQAKAHYDNATTAVADVVCGEDQYGIWFTGALRPDMDDIKIRRLRGSVLSGDWRDRGGRLELIAALAVNTPGYPVRRPMVRVASGLPQAMVAAGMITEQTIKKDSPTVPATSTGHRVVDEAFMERTVRQSLRDRVHPNT